MESKEINKSESTLTQGTMSRIVFPSFRIFLLSFSISQDCCMRFSDAPSVYICFLFLLFGFLCFPIFSSLVCFDFSLMLTSFCFWKYTYLHHWAIQTKMIENFFLEITFESLYKHQWYIAEIDIYVGKILLFERSSLISISEKSLSWSSIIFLRCPFSVKEWLKRCIPVIGSCFYKTSLELNKGQC